MCLVGEIKKNLHRYFLFLVIRNLFLLKFLHVMVKRVGNKGINKKKKTFNFADSANIRGNKYCYIVTLQSEFD